VGSEHTATENPWDPTNPGFIPDPPGYHLLEKLGTGGMGSVYRAQNLSTGAFVAIKFSLKPQQAERFRREYKELALLDHPNILKVYEFNAQAIPPYLVMEYLQGDTLSKFYRNLGNKHLPLHIGIPLFLKLTEALIYLHRRGIIHRDLKPSNLMVVSNRGLPDLKVMDFGIVHVDNASRPLTIKGQFIGTVKYSAPEQLLDSSTIGPRADLYSLGLILYEAFTGQFPFAADNTTEMREQHLNTIPRPPSALVPDLPPALDKLIVSLLQKNPANRPANAEIVQFVLNSITVTYPLAGRQVVQSAAQVCKGTILHRRFRIEKELGRGGFGKVFLATDLVLRQDVAVKVSEDISPEAIKQFQRETRILAGLNHPSLPRVRAYFIEADMQCLVMDFIPGNNLADVLQHAMKQLGKPIPEKDLLVWTDQICDALEYLHRQTPPVIHRDIKPENIIIGKDNRAFLADFGLAKIDPTTKTSTAAIGITPGYAPPEQYGRNADYTDIRSDVYALGATLYHLLTGKRSPESIAVRMGNEPRNIPRDE
jgi:serine/threonine protein kinase